MVERVDKKLSTRPVTKDDVVDVLNREIIPVVERIRRWTDAMGSVVQTGEGDPNGSVEATRPAIYVRSDGGVGTTLYYKSDDSADTGWVALP